LQKYYLLFVFTYKFFALAYFEGAPGAGNLNAHAYKNIEIFGKKYMRIILYFSPFTHFILVNSPVE
jgi:hypothetical protein